MRAKATYVEPYYRLNNFCRTRRFRKRNRVAFMIIVNILGEYTDMRKEDMGDMVSSTSLWPIRTVVIFISVA